MNIPAHEHILARCRSVSRRYLLTGLAISVLNTLALAFVLSGVAAVLEAVFFLSADIKTHIVYGIPAVLFLALAGQVWYSLLKGLSASDAARLIETAYSGFDDRLISAVQLGGQADESLRGQSAELVHALLDSVDRDLAAIDLAKAAPAATLVRSFRVLAGAVILVLVTGLLFPDIFFGGAYRLADNTRTYTPPDRTIIHITHRPATVIRGEDFAVSGFVAGTVPDDLALYFKWDNSSAWRMNPVEMDAVSGAFNALVEKPRSSFTYYLDSGDVSTTPDRVTVIERPDVDRIAVILEYPAYTGRQTDVIENHGGNIRALRGTNTTLEITANKPLSRMSILFDDDTAIPCTVNDGTGHVSFPVGESADYRISLEDTLGIGNADPITYRITALDDEYPAVTILNPPRDAVIPRALSVPLAYRAGDDYGITAVSLVYTLPYEEQEQRIKLATGNAGTDITKEYQWDLSAMNLLPDDTVSYFIEVEDNDTVAGPKRGVSKTGTLRMPSMKDILDGVNEEQQAGIEKLREISERSGEQERKLEDISRDIKSGRKVEWSEKTAVGEAREDLEQMRREMKDVAESIGDIADRLSEDDVAALETVEKMRKISELMNGIVDEDMRRALEQLTSAEVSLDPKEMEKALSEYDVNSEEIKKKLDRIIKLLEQAQSLQRFETAKRMLEDMAVEQAEISKEYRDNPDSPEVARKEEALSREMQSLQEEIDETLSEMDERFGMDTTDAQAAMKEHDPASEMENASQSMKQNMQAEAQESLDKANAGIAGLLKEMDMLGAKMEQQNTAEIKRRLFAALEDLLVVSRGQESLLESRSSEPLDILAERQISLIGTLEKAEKSLQSLGEVVVELAGIIDQVTTSTRMTMESALNGYTTGNKTMGDKNAASSLGMLNSTIHFLTTVMRQSEGMPGDQMMPGDLMQQLQNIANGQLQLQQQMGPGMMQQLAAEQKALSDMLSQLSEQISQDRRLREMLEELTREMDETSGMMRQNQPRERVERRQLDIYRRLLDARRSRRRKDEPEGRKSWTAKENISKGAERLSENMGERQTDIHARMNRALEDNFDPAYRELIRGYFESLMQGRTVEEGQ